MNTKWGELMVQKQIFQFADQILRLISGLLGLVFVPLSLFLAIFATDSGTSAAMGRGATTAIIGVFLGLLIIFASAFPERIEKTISASVATKIIIVRGPCYVISITCIVIAIAEKFTGLNGFWDMLPGFFHLTEG